MSVTFMTAKLPEGREVSVCLMDEDLVRVALTGGKEDVFLVVSLEQVMAISELTVELLKDKYEKGVHRQQPTH